MGGERGKGTSPINRKMNEMNVWQIVGIATGVGAGAVILINLGILLWRLLWRKVH